MTFILPKDDSRDAVQAFIPAISASQVNSAMTGTKVFGVGTGDVDVAEWTCLKVRPTADSTYYYNSDSAKTVTLPAEVETLVWVCQEDFASVTFAFGAGTAEVQGM